MHCRRRDVGTVIWKTTLPLVKDKGREVAHGDFSNSTDVGMLLYLSVHSWPGIAYAGNCAACYMFCPKHSNELTLKKAIRYLKAMCSRGLTLNQSTDLKIKTILILIFFAMCGHEKITNSACVKSRTDHAITVTDVPAFGSQNFSLNMLSYLWRQK